MKIKIISVNNYTHCYQIDDKILRLSFQKGSAKVIEKFYMIEAFLKSKGYQYDNTIFIQILKFTNFKNLMTILVTLFLNDFIEMFRYYARLNVSKVENFDKRHKNHCIPSDIFKDMFGDDNNSDLIKYQKVNYCTNEIYECMIKIIDDEFILFWISELKKIFKIKTNLGNVSGRIGIHNTYKICFDYLENDTINYLKDIANQFTINRETITYTKFTNYILDDKNAISTKSNQPLTSVIKQIVKYEFLKQFDLYVNENSKQLNIEKDIWKIYWHNGPSLNSKTHDFSSINSPTLRKEVKYYMKKRLNGFKNPNDIFVETINFALNYLTDNNKDIVFFTDISDVDVASLFLYLENDYVTQFKKSPSINSIKKTIKHCGLIVDYLSNGNRDSNLNTPIPKYNYFSRIQFKNLKRHHKKTDIIPEKVIEEISLHIKDLEKRHQVIYKIFINSALRLKELIYLEEDCIKPSKYEGLFILKYTPFKILLTRRRKNLDDYQEMLILTEVANSIQEQIERTKNLRIEYKSPFIFINQHNNCRASITKGVGFNSALNRLTKKYSIKGEAGEIYNITSRQFRKTLVVKLIEDGASTEEITYMLGHLSYTTAKDYYEEVRTIKLAKMNTKFFREKFEVIVSEKNLKTFTEGERRMLYVDFRLQQRRVELGHCARPFNDGPCDRRDRQYNCVSCEKLCTGKKYLPYWLKLRDSQRELVDEFIQFYIEHDMNEYKNYREYQQEYYLLNCYEEITDKILKFN